MAWKGMCMINKEANNKTACQYDSIWGKRDLKRT